MAHPTIATIAEHLGLSRATVTHVLNGRGDTQRIRPETQQRVQEAAQELGYRANASARAVRAGRFGSVALIQSLWGQYLPPELLNGLVSALGDQDLHLVLSQVHDPVLEDETYLPHTLRELAVDGVLLNRHLGFSAAYLERIQKLCIPAISLNVKQDFDAIHPDDLQGGQLATEFLLQLGHEKIAFVDSDESLNKHYSKQDRRHGYEQAMAVAGKPAHVHLIPKVWHHTHTDDERITSARGLLSGASRPTAIVAYELAEAMAVVHAAHQLGLKIPDDLSIILFHSRLDNRYFLPFHTISNQMERVGRGAVELLLGKIQNPKVLLPTRAIPAALLEGMTCQPPARKNER
ncbi:LacI family DNA-binding transcriptional regulator [Armatimonas sp.]|uniref:LacI family DNA-binding transcriptional regulator n=1 Tax=Armatimonas sp. TaxID=1872638 RepID=UPI003751162D